MSEIIVPELAESITEGTIAEWLKNPGDSVDKGEAVVELETDKVNVEVVSEEAGMIQELLAEAGDTVEVGQAIATVGEGSGSPSQSSSEDKKEDTSSKEDTSKSEEKSQPAASETSSKEESSSNSDQRVNATPSARKYAREKGIDLSEVEAKNSDVVRKNDIDRKQQGGQSNQGSQAAKSEAPAKKQNQEPSKPVVREKMSRRKQTAAKKLLEVSNNTAMLTTFNEVDMANVMNLRKRKKEQFIKDHDGTKLGFMSFFTKAAVAALKKYPAVNAEIDGDEMVTKQFYDIGIAVSTDNGLIVPFVRDCDKKNFAEIESSIADLAVKARDNKLSLGDLMNGSFTITNG
ncbi:dihydrolipoyllysine-residue succinyltransferase, partial [Staphylococcus carnosus]